MTLIYFIKIRCCVRKVVWLIKWTWRMNFIAITCSISIVKWTSHITWLLSHYLELSRCFIIILVVIDILFLLRFCDNCISLLIRDLVYYFIDIKWGIHFNVLVLRIISELGIRLMYEGTCFENFGLRLFKLVSVAQCRSLIL